jgi:BNR/Asp-box repeat
MQRSRFLTAVAAALVFGAPLSAQTLDSTVIAAFRWRNVGPSNFMGRLSDVQGIPSPSKTVYVATAAGGVWKSTNNGVSWRPIFDDKEVSSAGMLAIAPSDTNILYLGTGEPNSRNTIEPGAGVYKSTDGGAHWTFVGLRETQHIGRVQVDPRNANVVYVAALGPAWKAGGDRGLYKSTDGGATWKLIKAGANGHTGAIDVQLDPSNPDVVYLAMWERYRTPFSLNSGGVGSGLFKSTDGGATWTEIKGSGYPEGPKGRIGLSVARSNPQVVYALTEAASIEPGPVTFQRNPPANGLYRSTDGGKTWQHMNNVDTRPFYYSQVRADPKNPDRVYFSSTQLQVSNDGGKTLMNAAQNVHVDDHGIWIDPNDPERWFLANDGGVAITFDRGGNFWYPMNFPIGQFYDVSYDFDVPYNICSGAQDNGAWCGPSKRRNTPANNNQWFTISGGDGFYTAQDPTNPNMVWGESQNAGIQQTNLRTGERGRVNKPTWNEKYRQWEDSIAIVRGNPLEPVTKEAQAKIDAFRALQKKDSADMQIRYNWESPYFLSPHNPQVFYLGGSRVLKSLKRGEDLFAISPDLSVKTDPAQERARLAALDTVEKYTGGITLDLTGAEAYGTVVALQESPLKPGLLLAGTDNGNVWVTHNDGATWENLTPKFAPLGVPWEAYVVRVEPSHFDTLTFYVAFENHRRNDFKPYLFVTNDGGKTFRSIVNNLPTSSPADFLHVIREDPHNRDLLFVGSSRSAYVSIDRGQNWTKFATNLPTVPVYDLQIHPRDRELIAATHGRSLWIADIAALEQITPKVMAQGTYLFTPKTAYQWGEGPQPGLPGNGYGQAVMTYVNPTYGATITYRLAAAAPGAVRLIISNVAGDTLANLNGPGGAGVHNVTWNFQEAQRRGAAELSPSQRRDSILLHTRAPQVLDSLTKAGYDTAAIRTVRTQVTALSNPAGLGGGGGRGGGGRGGAGGGQACDHPTTQWEQFCARPAETTGGRGGGGGGGGGFGGLDSATAAAFAPANNPAAAAGRGGRGGGRGARGGRGQEAVGDLDPVARIWSIIGMNQPNVGGRGGGGGGGFGGGGANLANTGDYLVSMTIGGQTYKQTFRVERVSGGSDVGGGFGEDDEHDQSGRFTPKVPKAKTR